MFKKRNIRLLVALLTSCLSIQSQVINAMSNSSTPLHVKQNVKGNPKVPIISPTNDTMQTFYNIFDRLKIFHSSKSRYSANRYIGHLSKNIKLNKCPTYRYFESLDLISNPKPSDETNRWSCPYCGHRMTWTENCTCPQNDCLSNWVKSVCKFKVPIKYIRATNGYRERLCLLPTFLLLICNDYSNALEFEPVAKKWAIEMLNSGHEQDWKYVDKLFKNSVTTCSDIKSWLELAYQTYAKNQNNLTVFLRYIIQFDH